MRIVSIQSSVAYGHVGNSAAVFPLQRLGHEVIALNTVQFSNHTGYGAWRGPVTPVQDLRDVLAGLHERGVLGGVDAVLSGYLGAQPTGAFVLDAVDQIKALNPQARYVCDPVIGDVGRGVFVAEEIPAYLHDVVVPSADVLTPNHFELDYLVGRRTTTRAEVLEAIAEIQAIGPSTVLVTSVVHDDVPPASLAVMAAGPEGVFEAHTPRLPISPNGGGDLTAAVFLAHLDRGLPLALGHTVGSVAAVLQATMDRGERELALVAAQDAIADPTPALVVCVQEKITRSDISDQSR